jgi:iron complex transport system substrate-binding protein
MQMKSTRIVSFLPSATEMAFALGLGDQVVGITHECDYPPEAQGKPIVVRNVLPVETMSQPEIDAAVTQRMRDGLSLYQVDEKLLQELAPDIILTQNLCQVCAPSGNEVTHALTLLPKAPQVLWLTSATRNLSQRPRVFCVEWLDPIYCSGHWMPEMVEIAGGVDALARQGADSVRIPWEDVLQWAPEVLIITPCGFNLDKVIEQTSQLLKNPGWSELPAVRDGRVYAVDANSYFARPGPRVVEGTELLAHLIHPELFQWDGSPEAFRNVELSNAAPTNYTVASLS